MERFGAIEMFESEQILSPIYGPLAIVSVNTFLGNIDLLDWCQFSFGVYSGVFSRLENDVAVVDQNGRFVMRGLILSVLV